MKAFEVYLNGKLVATAGNGEDVLALGLSRVGKHSDAFHFRLGGIDGGTDEHVDWKVPTPTVGDEILIRIVEVEQVDPPTRREPMSE